MEIPKMTLEEFLDFYIRKEYDYDHLCSRYIPLKTAMLNSWTRCYNCKSFLRGPGCFTYLYIDIKPKIGIRRIRMMARAKAVYRCI